MNVRVSPYALSQVLDLKDLEQLFSHFANLTGIDVSLHDTEGEEILAYRIQGDNNICELVKSRQSNCNLQMKYAGFKAAELGDAYIFQCGTMVKCSVPILFEERYLGSVACGPVLLWEADEIARNDLVRFAANYDISEAKAYEILECVKELTPENMRSAAQMLQVMVSFMCKEESIFLQQRAKISTQQNKIADLMAERRITAQSIETLEKRNKFKKYPFELEKELIAFLQTGDTKKAMEILNSLLGEIFSLSSGNLDIIKANIYELTAVLMRAGVDAGVSLTEMSQILKKVTIILAETTQYDEVCLLTTEVMEEINRVISNNRFTKKSNENLINAISYIRNNYQHDLSLDTVAKSVFVSNYYLSHLFRDELNMTFSDYVNKVRMDEAIKLMKASGRSIQEIAQRSGFADASYFTKIFKKYHGITPKKYMSLYF